MYFKRKFVCLKHSEYKYFFHWDALLTSSRQTSLVTVKRVQPVIVLIGRGFAYDRMSAWQGWHQLTASFIKLIRRCKLKECTIFYGIFPVFTVTGTAHVGRLSDLWKVVVRRLWYVVTCYTYRREWIGIWWGLMEGLEHGWYESVTGKHVDSIYV